MFLSPVCQLHKASGGGGGLAALTSGAGSSLRNDYTGYVGFAFTPTRLLTVSSLGRWVVSGNSQTHSIGIWTTIALIASATVNCSGATPAQYLYHTLGTPLILATGTQYYLTSTETSGGDEWYNVFSGSSTSDLVINFACYGTGPATPASNVGAGVWVPPNFQYT